jgi:hypothetical protein
MVEIIRRLIVAGFALGVIAGNSGEFLEFYDEAVRNARHLATAADLRSIGTMLDYQLMKTGRYPSEEAFPAWMRSTFKENPTHALGTDHWGRPLAYATDGLRKTFLLASAGPDGIEGPRDDLRITGP